MTPTEVADKLAALQRVTAADELVITRDPPPRGSVAQPRTDRQTLGTRRLTDREGTSRKQIHLAVRVDPGADGSLDVVSLSRTVVAAEQGLFDFVLLGGAPSPFTALAALTG